MATETIPNSALGGASGDAAEPAITLDGAVPRTLGTWDQVAFWANLGVSLLGPVTALYILFPTTDAPQLSLLAAFTALVVGSVIGTLMVAISAVPGADTGAPAMVLLRGLFGVKLSYLPTVLNLLQCLGWGVFELVVIASGAQLLLPWDVHWPYVIAAGVLSTLMAIRPLGAVRVLRKYALSAVVLASIYLFVQLLRHPLPSLTHGTWSGFWTSTDVLIALSVSWVPLAADYSRHSKSARSSFIATLSGYATTQIAYVALGLLAFSTVVSTDAHDPQTDIFKAFIAVPVGWIAFAVLVARELDQSFANVYSTATSTQNLLPRVDRRLLAVIIGTTATLLGLVVQINDYAKFLSLIGSVFVPLSAVLAADYFLLGGRRGWNVSEEARTRWIALLPWLVGVATYQLIAPGDIAYWSDMWRGVASFLHWSSPTWMSASLASFAVAGLVTLLVGPLMRRSAGRAIAVPTSGSSSGSISGSSSGSSSGSTSRSLSVSGSDEG
ncbi:putative hydroxymethylpyrimidine transporter CytX [Frankineae bacterium MT45]|nr:putative hydroxymethylpyrimidine transporter CytX [Frankineae bacterium MT45]